MGDLSSWIAHDPHHGGLGARQIDHIGGADGSDERNQKISITTIENPIEYIFQNKQAVISQREIGDDVPDFRCGAIPSLRQDPDVILIGEIRDLETMRVSLQAAEKGFLLLSTLHTMGAVQTVARIIGTFPERNRNWFALKSSPTYR